MTERGILLLGPNGQVGWELRRALAVLGPVEAPRRDAPGGAGDLDDPERVAAGIRLAAPSLVVNAAAFTAVDRAEAEPERARRVNAEAPGAISRACAEVGAWMVHYSTDYVFDGSGERPWSEADPTGPLNVYGATKCDGEESIRAAGPGHLILRTSWVHGFHGANFVKTMLRLAAERERIAVVADQFGAPTGADLIADITAHAVRACRRDASLGGTYHLCAGGVATWHEVAVLAIERARTARPDIDWKVRSVEETTTEAYPTPARRPANSRLDTRRLRAAFDVHPPDWTEGVARLVDLCAAPASAPFGKLGSI
ncbi:MAG: dTDP-4-dehydrorhamnose reductase [Armatimonadota bacterium]